MGQVVKEKEASTIKKKIEVPQEKLELYQFTEIMIRVVGAVNKINEDLEFQKNRADLFEMKVKELNQRLSDYEKWKRESRENILRHRD